MPFNSLLGFSSFESTASSQKVQDINISFNSLLGFSSFESQPMRVKDIAEHIGFQFPIGIF